LNSSPQPQTIDNSATAYAAVAGEYYDSRLHPTCYNFNRLSRDFIGRHLLPRCAHRKILEVGAGESSVAPLLHAGGCPLGELTLSDSSREMLFHSNHWRELGARLLIGDAQQLCRWAPPTDCIVGGLGDPYNTECFWQEVSNLLPAGGAIIFTFPSYEWAIRFRRPDQTSQHTAQFVTGSGQTLYMPSYIPTLAHQVEIIERAGLIIVDFEALGREALGSDPVSPKLLGQVPKDSLVWGFVALKPGKSTPPDHRGL
jgi:hypothetical protein